MQKVKLQTKNKKELFLNDLDDSQFIGVEFKDETRGFVIKIEKNKYAISVINTNKYVSLVQKDTIQDLIVELFKIEHVYVFNTRIELLEWLKEEKKFKPLKDS